MAKTLYMYRICIQNGRNVDNHIREYHLRTLCLKEMVTESSPANIEDYKELLGGCKKNYLSKALLYMQKSLLLSTPGITTTEQKGLLQVYVGLPTLINITQKEYPSSNSTKSVTYQMCSDRQKIHSQ